MRRKKLSWYQWFFKSWPLLIVTWLFTGFALGTLILLFPLRAWVNYVRDNNVSGTVEKAGVVILMLALAIASFLISFKLYQWHLKKSRTITTIIVLAVPLICAIAALALFMNPDLVNKGAEASDISRRFTIGPYPTGDKIKQLKEEGFTGIISLLHPAVVPFEPSLLGDEEKAAKKNNIDLVKAPLLPWIGDNSSSLKKIEDLVRSGKGRYYIHCYLGKDRVNVVKNMINTITGESSVESENGPSHRTFERMKSFERGDIYKLGDDVYMTPYPTDEEFLSFFLAGKVRSVVNLLDPAVKENKEWINKERTELKKVTVQFRLFGLKEEPSVGSVATVVDSILILPKPIVIHRWGTASPDAKLFRKIFRDKTGFTPLNLASNAPESY